MTYTPRNTLLLQLISDQLTLLSQPPVCGEKNQLVRDLAKQEVYSRSEIAEAICYLDSKQSGATIDIDHSTGHQLVIRYNGHRISFSPADIVRLVPELTATSISPLMSE